jgi:glycosyltransferase involved in cell wall biosynthesis
VAASDAVLTVSPHYAHELLNSEQLPRDVVATLRRKGLRGILNGLNADAWDPARDPLLPTFTRYDSSNVAEGKAAAKRLLQQRLGLAVEPGMPLVAYLGRLEEQKGVGVLLAALPELLGPARGEAGSSSSSSHWGPVQRVRPAKPQQAVQGVLRRPVGPASPSSTSGPGPKGSSSSESQADAAVVAGSDAELHAATRVGGAVAAMPGVTQEAMEEVVPPAASAAATVQTVADTPPLPPPPFQLLVLGQGQAWMEEVVGALSARYPGAAVGVPAFNEPLAHLLMAAADFLVVPSRYEPCGLVALAALRYGTLPIAAATGGLVDIVRPGEAGLLFEAPSDSRDAYAMRRGVTALVAGVQQALAVYHTPELQRQRQAAMRRVVGWQRPAEAWEAELLSLVTPPAGLRGEAGAGDGQHNVLHPLAAGAGAGAAGASNHA